MNQIETHVFFQRNEDQALMKAHGVQIESWGPFAEGRNDMFHNEILTSIARKYNKSVAQVVLRWLTQRGVVAIPKSVHRERIVENFQIFDFQLDDNDMQQIASLDMKKSLFLDHHDPEIVKWLGTVKFES